jgi:hypothetical protein
MRIAVGILCMMASTAAADPSRDVIDVTVQARTFARRHDCAGVAALGRYVRDIDAAYYRGVFATDADIRDCEVVVGPKPGAKDPAIATELSLGVTGGGVALLVSGLLVRGHQPHAAPPLFVAGALVVIAGPSIGHIYTEDVANGWLAAEVGGLGAGALGVGIALAELDSHTGKDDLMVGLCAALFAGGGLAFVIGAGGNLATAARSADAYNHDHQLEMRVAPMAASNGIAPGVALSGRF